MMSTGRRLTKTETKQNKKFSPEHPNLGHRVERKLHIDPGFTSLGTLFSFINTAHCCTNGSEFLMEREHLEDQGIDEIVIKWTLKAGHTNDGAKLIHMKGSCQHINDLTGSRNIQESHRQHRSQLPKTYTAPRTYSSYKYC